MKTVYFVRHGQTQFNLQKRLQGWMDSPLSEQGRNQAKGIAEALEPLGVHYALVSPLGRSKETAQIIQERLGIHLEFTPNLREVSFGDFEGKTLPEIDITFPGMWAARMSDKWNYVPPGGESNKEAVPRAKKVVEEIEQYNDERPLLIIAHFAINRIILSLLTGLPSNDTVAINVPHHVIYRAQQHEDGWKVSYLDSQNGSFEFQPGYIRQEDPTKPMGG